MRIVTLEDNPLESRAIHKVVTDAGHECTTFMTGKAMISALANDMYDLLILNWNLQDISGMEVIRWVKESAGNDISVIVLADCAREDEIVEILMAGADDCIRKPFRDAELAARIHALTKRGRRPLTIEVPSTAQKVSKIEVGVYYFDLLRRTVSVRGEQIDLKPKEFDMAVLFFKNIGMQISREQIMAEIWGRKTDIYSRSLDTHASQLRSKLRLNSENQVRLISIHSFGYQLNVG
ncbi:two-component response regulator [Janthinobacterium sp. Marseille]|nr:response regulator transcription factor [Janthinobacterium sp. Marseille]ABR91568.1 two-component response regulator [Janthinobacterium sp. Marseille]